MNWNWRYNKINSSAPVKFLRETGVSRPGILVVRGLGCHRPWTKMHKKELCLPDLKMFSARAQRNGYFSRKSRWYICLYIIPKKDSKS